MNYIKKYNVIEHFNRCMAMQPFKPSASAYKQSIPPLSYPPTLGQQNMCAVIKAQHNLNQTYLHVTDTT
jgi:hypothetical protein